MAFRDTVDNLPFVVKCVCAWNVVYFCGTFLGLVPGFVDLLIYTTAMDIVYGFHLWKPFVWWMNVPGALNLLIGLYILMTQMAQTEKSMGSGLFLYRFVGFNALICLLMCTVTLLCSQLEEELIVLMAAPLMGIFPTYLCFMTITVMLDPEAQRQLYCLTVPAKFVPPIIVGVICLVFHFDIGIIAAYIIGLAFHYGYLDFMQEVPTGSWWRKLEDFMATKSGFVSPDGSMQQVSVDVEAQRPASSSSGQNFSSGGGQRLGSGSPAQTSSNQSGSLLSSLPTFGLGGSGGGAAGGGGGGGAQRLGGSPAPGNGPPPRKLPGTYVQMPGGGGSDTKPATNNSAPAAAAGGSAGPPEESVRALVEMGYQRGKALRALHASNNSVERAVAFLNQQS